MSASAMGRSAFVFPGQGSQFVGMGLSLSEAHPGSREIFERADRILGVKLSELCFRGPEEALRQTKNTQPAIFCHSIALLGAISGQPAMVAGHSLGEYSALVAAGALPFEDALRLVRRRGELMQEAGQELPGTMAAVVGLAPEIVEELCREASAQGAVQCANFNSPGQIVISGSVPGVRAAMELAKTRGAKLVKELVVSGAFHSSLMERARDGLKSGLEAAPICDARIPIYANVTGEPATRAAEIRELLFRQLTSPVRWEQSVRNMVRDGATRFTEVGPGKVLQGLIKRTDPKVALSGIDTWDDVIRHSKEGTAGDHAG
ncbi:MAG TPA: ACP S-malonyltransferase [Bacteroidota bacterium]|nr:ACP S-malonyltransferase [Bacteroidota bacterium]